MADDTGTRPTAPAARGKRSGVDRRATARARKHNGADMSRTTNGTRTKTRSGADTSRPAPGTQPNGTSTKTQRRRHTTNRRPTLTAPARAHDPRKQQHGYTADHASRRPTPQHENTAVSTHQHQHENTAVSTHQHQTTDANSTGTSTQPTAPDERHAHENTTVPT